MIKLTQVADGLLSPTFVAQAPGDPSRFYVLEQQGTMRVVKHGMLSASSTQRPAMSSRSSTRHGFCRQLSTAHRTRGYPCRPATSCVTICPGDPNASYTFGSGIVALRAQ